MGLKNKKTLSVMQNIHRNAHKKVWNCIEDNCRDKAINSHLLQRHGILDALIEKGHVIEVKAADIMHWDEEDSEVFSFKNVGLQNAISFPIFCQHHDTELFYDIEHGNMDLNNYHHQLLLSYRSLCAEIRKKQICLEIIDRMENSNILNENGSNSIFCKSQAKGINLSLRDLQVYRKEIQSELETSTNLFTFCHYSHPIFGVYASSSFSYDKDGENILGTIKSQNGKVWDNCFIHILPINNRTEIIIGYSNKHVNESLKQYVHSWNNIGKDELCIKMTNLFAGHIEGWGMSPSLYNKISNKNKEAFKRYVKNNAANYSIMQDVGFNLFEGCFCND